jgi:hypothetical protein
VTVWLLDQWSDALRESERRIAHGWYAALCAALFHAFLGGLVATTDGSWGGGFLYPSALVTLALAVARRSRIGAVLLVAQALWIYGSMIVRGRSVFAFLLLVGFGYWYASSVLGTFRYHRLQRERPEPDEPHLRPSAAAGA